MRSFATGEFRRDEDSHWYLIPDDLLKMFDDAREVLDGLDYMDNTRLFDRFEQKFGEYRVDGPYEYKVVIGDDNE